MPRTPATLPEGVRITDYISLGVIARTFPRETVDEVLEETGRSSERERSLPAHVMVYYVIAMALYMQVAYREVLRCLLEGLRWLLGPEVQLSVAGKSGISQARTRLGPQPLKLLYERIVAPIAVKRTQGAWYRKWRLVSLDGTTMAVADTADNEEAFGRPGQSRGKAAQPLVRLVSLVESGTHVLFGARMADYHTGEKTLAEQILPGLSSGMLCIADRNFYSFKLWQKARANGAELLWRVKKNMRLPCGRRLSDGSYLSRIYPSEKARRHDTSAVQVRVVEYTLEGVEDAEPIYRLITTILEPKKAPAHELAALYHERWEIETALGEFKTHLRGGADIVLRSKRPDLVIQELYGLLLAHFAIRGLMHEAALEHKRDPDELSFTHAVRVVRRTLPTFSAFSP
jgi:hypothetical protein